MSFSNLILTRIENAPWGKVFVISDFCDIASYDTARKTIERLEENGKIVKVTRGVYYKAKFSTLLNEPVSPDPKSVAAAIARNFGWSISPSGETALNLLGLSNQVPAKCTFISSGPYKVYDVGNTQICFVHRNDKELHGKSEITRLVIQSIKAIGKNSIKNRVDEISKIISPKDKKAILEESFHTTSWVYESIKQITK